MATTQTTLPPENSFSGTRPLTDRLEEVVESWARTHYELVTLAAEFADSPEWLLTGSPTAAHWLAIVADIEPSTTREWIRIGRKLADLPAIADAFKTRVISYSKVRTLTRLATPDNELELLHIATTTTDCGRNQLLEFDHIPAYEQTGHTITSELELRCAPCHHNRHTQNN